MLLCALAPLRETYFRFIALSWKLFHAKPQRRKVKCDISECSFVPWRLCVKLTFALSLYRGSCFTQRRKDAKSNAISLKLLCALAPLRETHFRTFALSWKLFHAKAQRRKVKYDISEAPLCLGAFA